MEAKMIEKIISSKENFSRFTHALACKSFSKRCAKYNVPFDERLQEMTSKIADHHVEKYWPWDDYELYNNFHVFLSNLNYDGSWDIVESHSRIEVGVEVFLKSVEPQDEFKRLHGAFFETMV